MFFFIIGVVLCNFSKNTTKTVCPRCSWDGEWRGCLITGDVNLDHLVKGVACGFTTIQLLFSLIINKYIEKDTLRLYTYPVSP